MWIQLTELNSVEATKQGESNRIGPSLKKVQIPCPSRASSYAWMEVEGKVTELKSTPRMVANWNDPIVTSASQFQKGSKISIYDHHPSQTMKTIITSLLLLAAIVLPLHADSPLPATSSIEIKITRTVKIAEEPNKEEEKARKAENPKYHDCFADSARYSLEPHFKRGLDAKASNLLLNTYIITTDTERKMAILKPVSQMIPSDPKIPLVADTTYSHRLQWRCDCRTRGDKMQKSPEWYAEIIQDGKVLCSAKSASNTTINQLIANRIQMLDITPKAYPFLGKWCCNGKERDIYQIKSDKTATHLGDKGSWNTTDDLLTISWENGHRLTIDMTQSNEPILVRSYPPGRPEQDKFKFTKPLLIITLPSSRVITDTQGRRISGIILSKIGNSISFQRDSDGKIVSISTDKLSEDDKKFISSAIQARE